ncbi:MAG: GntR family transcriptional regulator, partial [bacterium]|nr:GntR family transcriptional regulator [bacterium]
PLYLQIAQSIKHAIETGILRYADILPTEKDLCNAFSCSRIVAKMAYDLLAHEQYVDRIQGKGTFVSNRPKWTINVEKILQIDTSGKIQQHSVTKKNVFHSNSSDHSRVASILGLPSNERIIHYRRVFLVGSNPILLQSCYCPESFIKSSLISLSDDENFFHWIEKMTKRKIHSVTNRVGVIDLETWESYMLRVSPSCAAHICRGIIHSQENTPLAYVEMKLPYTAFRLEITNYD